ncbi:MAG: hypothetical protein M3A44_03195 [Gammaproteobacteria bacterium]
MTIPPELILRFPDLLKSQEAMKRAAAQARRLAEQTGTRLIVADKVAATVRPEPADKQSAD